MRTFTPAALAICIPLALVAAPAVAESVPAPAEAAGVIVAKSTKKHPSLWKDTGYLPQWVQRPYLVRKSKSKFQLKGSVFVDPHRTKTKGTKQRDRVDVQVRVAKTKYIKLNRRRDVGMLPADNLSSTFKETIRPNQRGVEDFTATLPKKTSKDLASVGKRKRMRAVSIVVIHNKSTTPKKTAWSLKQVLPAPMARHKYSQKRFKNALAAAKAQTQASYKARPSSPGKDPEKGSSLSKAYGNEGWYNVVWVQNASPFVQQVNLNPDVQCMWTGSTPGANLASQVPGVAPGTSVQFSLPYTSTASNQPGLAGATDNMNAPGTTGSLISDVAAAGVAAGQTALANLELPTTYNEDGAIGAVANTAVTFAIQILEDAIDGTSTCNDVSTYPELFSVSSTVTGFGYDNAQSANGASGNYPAPNTWNTTQPPDYNGLYVSPGAAGTGGSSSQPPAGFLSPTGSATGGSIYSMLGAQTNATYYWNGGQPAPMVSNNASSGSTSGGSASFQGGLYQWVVTNPSQPSMVLYPTYNSAGQQTGYDYSSPIWGNYSGNYTNCLLSGGGCSMINGIVPIQLGMMMNPETAAGLWLNGQPNVSISGNESSGYSVTCDISPVTATMQLPFGTNGMTPALQNQSIASATSGAQYNVGFWAQTADGQFVYWKASDAVGPNGITQPYLAPNASSTTIKMSSSQTTASGSITPGDLQDVSNFITADGDPLSSFSDVAAMGCNVTASASLLGEPITGSSAQWGTNWPMPNGMNNGWPDSSDMPSWWYNFDWMNPVQKLNVNFQSMPSGNCAVTPGYSGETPANCTSG